MNDPFSLEDPEKLALFVQEYIRREGQEDAGVVAVVAAQLRNPQYLPHQIAERLLATPEIQGAIKAAKSFYHPTPSREVSPASISTDMEDVFQKALEARQFSAAIQAKSKQAELHGFIRKDVNINISHRVQDFTTAELLRIARDGPEKLLETIDGTFTEVPEK